MLSESHPRSLRGVSGDILKAERGAASTDATSPWRHYRNGAKVLVSLRLVRLRQFLDVPPRLT